MLLGFVGLENVYPSSLENTIVSSMLLDIHGECDIPTPRAN